MSGGIVTVGFNSNPSTFIANGTTYTFSSVNGGIYYYIGSGVSSVGGFRNYTTLVSLDIGTGVVNINDNAFQDCVNLSTITISDTVTNIGSSSFQMCTAIASIILPNSLIVLDYQAFYGCSNLSSISLPSNLTEINAAVFYNCTGLKSVTIPSSVTLITNLSFGNCSSLTSVTFLEKSNILTFSHQNSFSNTSSFTAAYMYRANTNAATYLNTNNPSVTISYLEDTPCFLEGSKILTDKGYVKIEELKKGDLVKSALDGYKKIDMIGRKKIDHLGIEVRIKDQLYKCTKENYPEILEDLIITGCHSILVDDFKNEKEKKRTIEINGDTYVTGNKYRLPACADERAVVYEKKGDYKVYHVALENDDYYKNYGIYANGLLVESCSIGYLKELSVMELL